jgi:hypothetical protein
VAVARSRGRNLNEILAERKARRLSRLRAILLIVLGATALYALLHALYEQRSDPAFERLRLVVVPLDNRTGDAAFDTVGLVASDWITNVLSGYAGAREVVPTTTTLAYMHSARLARHDLLNRALELARGTRAQIVVWGTFYRTGDSIRFNVEIQDLKTSLMIGSVPQIAAPVTNVMPAIDRLRNIVVREVLKTEWYNRPQLRPVPNLAAYQSFVTGLHHYVNRRYAAAGNAFAASRAQDTISWLPHQIWLVDALRESRQFIAAETASRQLHGRRVTRADEARAMRARARLRMDRDESYSWASMLPLQNRADDMAQYEFAVEALASAKPRAARRAFSELRGHVGFLHGRPEFFLHHAAAYHLFASHHQELRVVRAGLMMRYRSLDVRLANCRARAALGDRDNALAALNAIAAPDTDTVSVFTVGEALDDCGAELDAHGLVDVAGRAAQLSRGWHARRPSRPRIVRDPEYERAYVALEQARALAERGDGGAALSMLYDALSDGLPYYEPGRMMLHAEPAFRRLRNTRGFVRINQTRG